MSKGRDFQNNSERLGKPENQRNRKTRNNSERLSKTEFRNIRRSGNILAMIKDVTDLEVYREALRLLPEIYNLTKMISKSEYDLVLQVRRAGKSIAANITEGFAKRASEKEFKRFLKITIGSSDEVITHLRMIAIVQPRFAFEANQLAENYKVLSKRINSLHTHWQSGGTFQNNSDQNNSEKLGTSTNQKI